MLSVNGGGSISGFPIVSCFRMMLVHHTDAEREYAYDRKSHVGRLDKALDEAGKNDCPVVDMKSDWKIIYPFEL